MATVRKIVTNTAEDIEKLECSARQDTNGSASLKNSFGVFSKSFSNIKVLGLERNCRYETVLLKPLDVG